VTGTPHRALPIWSPAGARVVERPVVRRGTSLSSASRPVDRDLVVAEEPLEIRIAGESLMVTMRTPGDDLDLAAGLLFTEGVISSLDDTITLAAGGATERERGNVVEVTAADGRRLNLQAARRVLRATAACGLCGKENIAAVRRRLAPVAAGADLRIPLSVILRMPESIRAAQPVFAATGGLHAVGLFASDGALLLVREDVGRHNAVDKVIGAQLRSGAGRFGQSVMFLSGRAGFELIQKAAVAGVPVVCSVSAPSALAVDLADEVGITLVGFVRGGSANVYTHGQRIV
jgi:FdhD protein